MTYKSQILFGEVKNTQESLVQKYNIETFPSVLWFDSADSEPIAFEGKPTPTSLHTFFEKRLKSQDNAASSTSSTEIKKEPVSIYNIGDVEKCSGKKLCVISFVQLQENNTFEEKETLERVIRYYGKDGKFEFLVSGSTTNLSKFGLTQVPSMVIYNVKRSKYVPIDNFNFESIEMTLDRVLGGDASYKTISE